MYKHIHLYAIRSLNCIMALPSIRWATEHKVPVVVVKNKNEDSLKLIEWVLYRFKPKTIRYRNKVFELEFRSKWFGRTMRSVQKTSRAMAAAFLSCIVFWMYAVWFLPLQAR